MLINRIKHFIHAKEQENLVSVIYFDRDGDIQQETNIEDINKAERAGFIACSYRVNLLTIEWWFKPSDAAKQKLIKWLKKQPLCEYKIMPPAQSDIARIANFKHALSYINKIMKTSR